MIYLYVFHTSEHYGRELEEEITSFYFFPITHQSKKQVQLNRYVWIRILYVVL